MFRLTIRELLLAMTLTAVSVTWCLDSQVGSKNARELAELKMELQQSQSAREALQAELERSPMRWPPPGPMRMPPPRRGR